MKVRGFSLIELVIVLMIISLSLALVAPSFSRFSRAVELRAAAKKICGILRHYRGEAIARGKVQQVLFDSDLREVKVLSLTVETENGEEKKEALQKKYTLPEGIQMKELKIPASQHPSDLPAIEFYPNGSSNGGSILLESENRSFRIKVYFPTGMIRAEGA